MTIFAIIFLISHFQLYISSYLYSNIFENILFQFEN